MGLKVKGKGNSSSVNGGRIQRKGMVEGTDHWAFLEEIEAPMWVDLTLEAQFMDQDINEAWFHTTHPIHQLSSRHLKSSFPHYAEERPESLEMLCKSPKLPNSVSRSRGKHYRSRKWGGEKLVFEMGKQHPIRKLGGKGSWMVFGVNASASNSTSTVTTHSSPAKPKSSFVSLKSNSNLKASSVAGTNSTGSVISKYPCSKPKRSFGDSKSTSNSKPAASQVSCLTNGVLEPATRRSITRGSTAFRQSLGKETKGTEFLKYRKSSSSKSSVGSSLSLRSKLENLNSCARMKEERTMKSKIATSSIVALGKSDSQPPNRNSSFKHGGKANDGKISCQESKAKVLRSTTSRKPLGLLNVAETVNEKVATRSKQNTGVGKIADDKATASSCRVRNPKVLKVRKEVLSRNGLSDLKGKANGVKQDTIPTKVIPRTYFR